MYFAGIIAFLAFLFFSTSIYTRVGTFVDPLSIIISLSFSFTMLLASGLLPDFLRGLKLMGQKENTYTIIELKKTVEAVKLMIRLLIASGTLGALIGIVGILTKLADISMLGPNLAVALLTMFYSVLFILILLPVQAKASAIIHTLE
ncbi:MAG: MotA/TolQ/ExbB proton channel family protein [Bacillota bacterium]